MTVMFRRLPAVCFALALVASTAVAQDYPSRPVKILVGFGPGGLGDIVTRSVAQKLAAQMGQPFVIENMPGAGGITAAATAARSQPDGHTLLLVSGQNATAPLVFKSLPFNPSADFRMVSTLSNFDFIIVVDRASPLRSIADLVMAAKSAPGRFNFGTISSGSLQNLMSHLFRGAGQPEGSDRTVPNDRRSGCGAARRPGAGRDRDGPRCRRSGAVRAAACARAIV